MKLGVCAGTVNADLNLLAPAVTTAFGVGQNSMSDEFLNLPSGMEFVPLTFEQEPQESWARFITWPSYQHKWLIGNEPCTNNDGNKSPEEVAAVMVRQMKAIKAFDPAAQFVLTMGTQGQAPYNPYNNNQSLIDALMNARGINGNLIIAPRFYTNIFGFHFHYYPRWRSDNDAIRWDTDQFVAHANNCRRWMSENGFASKKLWCSELGFEGYFAGDSRPAQYIAELKPKFSGCVDRAYFYVANNRAGSDGSNGYLPLIENGNLTDQGEAWTGSV